MGVRLCDAHLTLLDLRVEAALIDVVGGLDMKDIIVLREVQSLLFDPVPRLVGLLGGSSAS